VLAEASTRADVSVTFSIPTIDDDVWLTTEPGTAPPRQRLRALRTLVDAGVRASVGMAPLLPGLSDHPSSLARVVEAAREAGACGIWANLLHLQPGTREHFLACLERDWPELLPDYERLYARSGYLPQREMAPAKDEVRRLAVRSGIADRRAVKLRPKPRDEQLSLLSA
jgi:DNA repair photolyase